ncbi:MAG: dihydrodipicolinate synthase family protein [Acidobacteria bacterium]|nr:dihydrodipicolinate synthase family protein [Acidobacteriota bacterium]
MLPFQGVLAAAVTPSRADAYQMDMGAALEVVDFLCGRRVSGIVLFGATGEFPNFSVEDRVRLAQMAIKRSRVPVIINATCACLEEAETIAGHARANGAAGILMQPPYYFRYGAAEIREYLVEFAEGIGNDVPLLLYNLPAYNNAIPVEVAEEMLLEGRYAGIKDSSGDWNYLWRLLQARAKRDFTVLVGNDALFVRGLAAGAPGVISGCACAVPELMIALEEAVRASHDARIVRLSARLDEFMSRIDQFPGPYGIREALSVRGLKMGRRANPLAPATEQIAGEFREWFRGWLPVVQQEAAGA